MNNHDRVIVPLILDACGTITRDAIEGALKQMAICLAEKLDRLAHDERRLCPLITKANEMSHF